MLKGDGNLGASYFFCMRSYSEVGGIGHRLRELMSFILAMYTCTSLSA